jgi:hypothetical protein
MKNKQNAQNACWAKRNNLQLRLLVRFTRYVLREFIENKVSQLLQNQERVSYIKCFGQHRQTPW